MEELLAALGHRGRLTVVMFLLAHGPARQVEIRNRLEQLWGHSVNPGTVTALLKPLFEHGVVIRQGSRGPSSRAPIEIRDPQRVTALLQVAAAMSDEHANRDRAVTGRDVDGLRRALFRTLPETDVSS
jgi:DNA-binding HxlR family transcriptional regulator